MCKKINKIKIKQVLENTLNLISQLLPTPLYPENEQYLNFKFIFKMSSSNYKDHLPIVIN